MVKELQSNINGMKIRDVNGAELKGAVKTSTGAIVYCNKKALDNYILKKEAMLSQSRTVQSLLDQIEDLKRMIESKNG